jgi:metallo-beta-lactamase class B
VHPIGTRSRNRKTNIRTASPKRDIVAADGQKITLGDSSVTLITTPGHTPGTLSMIFQVKDNGRPLTVAYSGGTAFNFVNDVPHFDTYINSQRKMAEAATRAGATVLMSNHSEFDNAVTKIKLMAARKPGEPHPFEIGREGGGALFQSHRRMRPGRAAEAALAREFAPMDPEKSC